MKTINLFLFKKIVCILKITRVQLGTIFTAALCNNEVTGRPTSYFYRGKGSTLFRCLRGIEINLISMWLLLNNLIGIEMLLEIQKFLLFYLKKKTFFIHFGGNSVTKTKRVLFSLTFHSI